jgi:CubicO group peptidase (beta-lactamase class C family)
VDALAEALSKTGAARAAAVVVGDRGVLESAGATAEPFGLASVTKTLSAYAVLVAVEEGSISLDDGVGPPGATVRHLLAHASGLGTEARSRTIPPGTRRVYSNVGFDLLADHVTAATGMSFATYLAESVLRPLQMTTSGLAGSAARDGTASADDLSRFAAELLSPTLLDPATVAEATSVVFAGLDGVLPGFGEMRPCDWGLGFEIRDHKVPHWTGSANSPRTFGHFGQSGTFLSVDPDARLGIVVLTDRRFGDAAKLAWPSLADGVLSRLSG